MISTQKALFTASVAVFAQFGFAQTLQEGTEAIDSHKYAKAKEIFSSMVASSPTAENYFYLGNTYLSQNDPNFAIAAENFNKGAAIGKRDFLNKIGLASIKLGKGDKSGIIEIQNIVKESKEKDAEVLYRAGEALTMYDKVNDPILAIDYINKAIEKSKIVPAYYYYTLGDAYRMQLTNSPQVAGSAMTAYDKALPIAKNKASVYTRMATLWMAAKQWQLAKENIDKAIAADASYAPVYKAKAGFDIKYQQNALATQDLVNYAKYADEDPYTQLEIAKLFFTNEDYENAKTTLDKVFDKVDDPIKYKLRAYLLYANGDYAAAKSNMEQFVSKADKSRLQTGDEGLLGLISVGLAKNEKDEAVKASLLADAKAKVAKAKAAKDETFNWDEELAKIAGGGTISQASADEGPTSPEITALKTQVKANPQDTNVLFKLATAYQDVKNWNGAILTWQKISGLLPDWAPGYYSQGYAYQQAGQTELAKLNYEKFISKVKPNEVEANKEILSYAYFAVAYLVKDSDKVKAKQYAAKSVELNPSYKDAQSLVAELNK